MAIKDPSYRQIWVSSFSTPKTSTFHGIVTYPAINAQIKTIYKQIQLPFINQGNLLVVLLYHPYLQDLSIAKPFRLKGLSNALSIYHVNLLGDNHVLHKHNQLYFNRCKSFKSFVVSYIR